MSVSIDGTGILSGVTTFTTENFDITHINSTGISTFSGGVNLGTGTTISSPASDTFTVSTNGSERVRVDSVGCVGIGTDDPVAKLDISNGKQIIKQNINGEGGALYLSNSNTGSSAYSVIRFTDNDIINSSGKAYIHYFNENWPSNGYWDAKSLASGTVDGNINFSVGGNNQFKVWTNATQRFAVDGSGRVTMPYQPSTCRRVTAGTVIGDQLIPWDTAILSSSDISYNTTTRRFTVSISGKYEITFSGFKTPSGAARVMLGVNTDAPTTASNYGHTYTGGTNYDSINFCVILNLSANDYFTFRVSEGTLYSQPSDQFNFMTAFLIG